MQGSTKTIERRSRQRGVHQGLTLCEILGRLLGQAASLDQDAFLAAHDV